MAIFKATFCDPFKSDIVQLGEIPADSVMEVFEKIPWIDYLKQMEGREEEVHYSPSFGLNNVETNIGLECSLVDEKEWYIFFKRPKLVKTFFGLSEKMDNDYMTEIHGQTQAHVVECLNALLRGDLTFLENKIK